jgi:2'-5' RNA ligase
VRSFAAGTLPSRLGSSIGYTPMPIHQLVHRAVRRARAISGIGLSRNFRQLEAAVILLPPDRVQNAIRRWQLEILRRHGRCPGIDAPPHVTLKLGFKCLDAHAIANDIAEIATRSEPVVLHLRQLGRFDEGILYLDVGESTPFELLREFTLRTLESRHGIKPRPIEISGFHPHLTLVRDLSDNQLRVELERFTEISMEFHCIADKIGLLVDIDGRWINFASFSLGSNGA